MFDQSYSTDERVSVVNFVRATWKRYGRSGFFALDNKIKIDLSDFDVNRSTFVVDKDNFPYLKLGLADMYLERDVVPENK